MKMPLAAAKNHVFVEIYIVQELIKFTIRRFRIGNPAWTLFRKTTIKPRSLIQCEAVENRDIE